MALQRLRTRVLHWQRGRENGHLVQPVRARREGATDQLHVASRLSFAKLGWSCAVCMRRSFAVCCHQSLQAIIMASKDNLPVFRATKCEGGTDTHTHGHAHAHTSVVRAAFRGAAQCSYGLHFSPHRSSQVKLRLDCVSTRQVPAQVRRDALRDLPAELVPDGRAPATFHIEGALHVTNASLLPGPARGRLPLQFALTEWHAAVHTVPLRRVQVRRNVLGAKRLGRLQLHPVSDRRKLPGPREPALRTAELLDALLQRLARAHGCHRARRDLHRVHSVLPRRILCGRARNQLFGALQ